MKQNRKLIDPLRAAMAAELNKELRTKFKSSRVENKHKDTKTRKGAKDFKKCHDPFSFNQQPANRGFSFFHPAPLS